MQLKSLPLLPAGAHCSRPPLRAVQLAHVLLRASVHRSACLGLGLPRTPPLETLLASTTIARHKLRLGLVSATGAQRIVCIVEQADLDGVAECAACSAPSTNFCTKFDSNRIIIAVTVGVFNYPLGKPLSSLPPKKLRLHA